MSNSIYILTKIKMYEEAEQSVMPKEYHTDEYIMNLCDEIWVE